MLENKVWFLGQQLDAEVRTPCAACSRAVSAHAGTRIYTKPGYWGTCQCCQNSHQLLAAHCTVNRGTLCQTKEAGKECPAQPSRQSKQRCRNKNAMTKSWKSFMHQGLVQPEDTAGIPPLAVPGWHAVKQLWAALKISLSLVHILAVTQLAVWEGLYQACSKNRSSWKLSHCKILIFIYRIRNWGFPWSLMQSKEWMPTVSKLNYRLQLHQFHGLFFPHSTTQHLNVIYENQIGNFFWNRWKKIREAM